MVVIGCLKTKKKPHSTKKRNFHGEWSKSRRCGSKNEERSLYAKTFWGMSKPSDIKTIGKTSKFSNAGSSATASDRPSLCSKLTRRSRNHAAMVMTLPAFPRLPFREPPPMGTPHWGSTVKKPPYHELLSAPLEPYTHLASSVCRTMRPRQARLR